MAGVVGAELLEKLENPAKFQWSTAGAGQPLRGYGRLDRLNSAAGAGMA